MGAVAVPILVGVGSAVAGAAISSFMTPDTPSFDAPTPEDLPDAPEADSEAVQAAADEQRKRASKSGRASTVLSSGSGLLAEDDEVSASKLLKG